MVKGACLPHLDSPQRSYLQIGLHVTCAILQLLSVFMPFCSSLSKILRDEQIELVTNTKVPGGFVWGQGVLYELGLGGGEVSGLFTKIRMILDDITFLPAPPYRQLCPDHGVRSRRGPVALA